MKLSTKGHYGVMAMLELALHHGQGPMPLNNIAKRQHLSEAYLEQLFASLRKAGLVKSIRGAQGGYLLGKEPKDINVGEIIKVLEGPIAPVECVNEQDPDICQRSSQCITRNLWAKVRDSINEVLDSVTLADLVEEANQAKADNYMYYI